MVEVPCCHERPVPFSVRIPDRSSDSILVINPSNELGPKQGDYRSWFGSTSPSILTDFIGCGNDQRNSERRIDSNRQRLARAGPMEESSVFQSRRSGHRPCRQIDLLLRSPTLRGVARLSIERRRCRPAPVRWPVVF